MLADLSAPALARRRDEDMAAEAAESLRVSYLDRAADVALERARDAEGKDDRKRASLWFAAYRRLADVVMR